MYGRVAISSPAAITRATTLDPAVLLDDSPSDEPETADAGGFSVSWLLIPSTLHVAGPTTPSTVRPWRACRRLTADSVSEPKLPSALRCSALCSRETASPLTSSPPSPVSATVALVPWECFAAAATTDDGGVSVSSLETPSTLHVAG